jgi:hypothetical protein
MNNKYFINIILNMSVTSALKLMQRKNLSPAQPGRRR